MRTKEQKLNARKYPFIAQINGKGYLNGKIFGVELKGEIMVGSEMSFWGMFRELMERVIAECGGMDHPHSMRVTVYPAKAVKGA
jgi:hypothetical protein